MAPLDSALAGDEPPVTVIRTGWPQAEEPVTRTASWPSAWVAAAMAGCVQDAPPDDGWQSQPLPPGGPRASCEPGTPGR